MEIQNRFQALATADEYEDYDDHVCGTVHLPPEEEEVDDGELISTQSEGHTRCLRGGVTRSPSEVPPAGPVGGEGLATLPGAPTGSRHYRIPGSGARTSAESHDRQVGVLMVEGRAGAERLVCGLERRGAGWRTVAAVVDSGAEVTVAPPETFPGKMQMSAMQRAGGRYRAANGARIPNLGETNAAFNTEEGHPCTLKFQIAGVERPLISVAQLTRTGHKVEFGAAAGQIVHVATGRRMKLHRVGGTYVLRMKIKEGTGTGAAAGAAGFARPRK